MALVSITGNYRFFRLEVNWRDVQMIGMTENSEDRSGTVAEETGRRVAARRLKLGLSQQAMGQMVGVSQSTVADWERGKTRPRPHIWPKLAITLEVDVESLFPDMGFAERKEATLPQVNEPIQYFSKSEKLRFELEDRCFLVLYDYLKGLTEEFPEFTAEHSMHHAGEAYIDGDRGIALLTWLAWRQILEQGDTEPLPERTMRMASEYRKMMEKATSITRSYRQAIGKTG